MPVSLSQYRGTVGVFNGQFVHYKQFNFSYSDSFRKLNMPAVSSVYFHIHICVHEVISSKWSTLYVFIKKEY